MESAIIFIALIVLYISIGMAIVELAEKFKLIKVDHWNREPIVLFAVSLFPLAIIYITSKYVSRFIVWLVMFLIKHVNEYVRTYFNQGDNDGV